MTQRRWCNRHVDVASRYRNALQMEERGLTSALLEMAELCTFPPRSLIFERGTTASGVYVILAVRAALLSGPRVASRRQPAEIAGSGVILGLGEVLAEGRHCLTAESAGQVEAAYISRTKLVALVRHNPAIGGALRRLLAGKIDAVHQSHRLLGSPGLRTPPRRAVCQP